jgi:uncharacterized protein (UPF0332 family)
LSPEAAHALATARPQLADAKSILRLPIAGAAAREACLGAFHAVEAFVFSRTGRAAKTHGGLRTTFARLAKDELRTDPAFLGFLARAYDLKSIADYATDPTRKVSPEEAAWTIETAELFIDLLAGLAE